MNPSGGFFCFMRASFNNAMRPANAGDEAEVPSAVKGWPCQNMRKFVDCAETSGIACTKTVSK